MPPTFTAHNIRLDDGTQTKPDIGYTIDAHPWFVSSKHLLKTVYPGDRSHLRLADLGCLEGGYTVEFARMGFDALGLEVRESNHAACEYVRSRISVPKLRFVQDNAWNIERYGVFDVMFCCGLFYHLDRPREFLKLLSRTTRKVLILQTHFSTDQDNPNYNLSPMAEHEGLKGRWYSEFPTDESFSDRENSRWSSWDNTRSFWIKREHLLQAIHESGFNVVMEQFDSLAPDIATSIESGPYKAHERGTFIAIKSSP